MKTIFYPFPSLSPRIKTSTRHPDSGSLFQVLTKLPIFHDTGCLATDPALEIAQHDAVNLGELVRFGDPRARLLSFVSSENEHLWVCDSQEIFILDLRKS